MTNDVIISDFLLLPAGQLNSKDLLNSNKN